MSMEHNILIASDYSADSCGNFIASLFELGIRLKNGGYVVKQIVFAFPKNKNTENKESWVSWLRDSGFQVILIDKEKSMQDQKDELKNIIQIFHVDILHIHFDFWRELIMKYKFPGKVIVHDHMGFPVNGGRLRHIYHRAHCILRSLEYRRRDIVVISVSAEKDAWYWFAKHHHIPNGLSFNRNIPKTEDRDTCRNHLGISSDEKFCFMLGWAHYIKGFDIALKAVEVCRKKDPAIVLGLVGAGEKTPRNNAIEFIKKYTNIDPYSPWIRYLPSTSDIFAYHRAADVYLSSSRSESFSYGLLEAISQRVPVVISDIQGTKWASEYNHAFFYPVEDYIACSNAILNALKVAPQCANSEFVVENYSIEKWCNNIISVYESLV